MHEIIFVPENLIKILGFTSKFRYGRVTLNTGIFLLVLPHYNNRVELWLPNCFNMQFY